MQKQTNDFTGTLLIDYREADVCRIGQGKKCCAYLACSAKGLCCERRSEFGGIIESKLAAGTMTSRGAGGWEGCAFEGVIPNGDMEIVDPH